MAYIRKVKAENISELASFSVNGIKDIQHRTFLREIYLASISLRNPAAAFADFMNLEDMTSTIIEGLFDDISVSALNNAILEKAFKESFQIEKELETISEHEAKDYMRNLLRQAGQPEENVDLVLDAIIKKLNLDMSRAELMKALINAKLAGHMKSRAEQLKPTLRVKSKATRAGSS